PAPSSAPAGGAAVRPRVLFACTGNSARSPIAAALLRHRGGGHVEVMSAGSHPKARMHPNAVRVLREEYGLDLAGVRPRHLDAVDPRRFSHLISLCDKVREAHPAFGERPRPTHWSIPDPAATGGDDQVSYPAFVDTARELDTRIRRLLPVLTPATTPEVPS
ncbi:arsenate reductase ArsC, partial [Nonomuraea mesophila]